MRRVIPSGFGIVGMSSIADLENFSALSNCWAAFGMFAFHALGSVWPRIAKSLHIVRSQSDILLASVLHLLDLVFRQIKFHEARIHRCKVAALRVFQHKRFASLNFLGSVRQRHGCERLECCIFLRVHRWRRRVQRQSIRFVFIGLLLGRRRALATLTTLSALAAAHFVQPPQRIPLTAILQEPLLPSTSATSPSFPASCLLLQVVARVRRLEIHRVILPKFSQFPFLTLRPLGWFLKVHGFESLLRRLPGLSGTARHGERRLKLALGESLLSFVIINPRQIDMRPGHHHGVLRGCVGSRW